MPFLLTRIWPGRLRNQGTQELEKWNLTVDLVIVEVLSLVEVFMTLLRVEITLLVHLVEEGSEA
jgi:hypothetical protein